jgi:hypothetical protein
MRCFELLLCLTVRSNVAAVADMLFSLLLDGYIASLTVSTSTLDMKAALGCAEAARGTLAKAGTDDAYASEKAGTAGMKALDERCVRIFIVVHAWADVVYMQSAPG